MKKYKILDFEPESQLFYKFDAERIGKIEKSINEYAECGWKVISCVPRTQLGHTVGLIVILEGDE